MSPAVLLLAALVPAADPPEPPYPLAVGHTWTYRVLFQEDKFVVRVARTEVVGGHPCFVLEGRLRDRVVATEHVAVTPDGPARVRADHTDVGPPVVFLKPAAARKMSWTADYQMGERKAKATFTQEAATVQVPAGKFAAALVTAEMVTETGGRARTSAWYAPGVGLVRQQVGEGKGGYSLELEKFEKGE